MAKTDTINWLFKTKIGRCAILLIVLIILLMILLMQPRPELLG